MLVGYARVSTADQNLDLQLSALQQAGCEKIYQDQVSGTKVHRPGLSMVLEVLRKHDTLVVWKLDRLGRTVIRKRILNNSPTLVDELFNLIGII